MSNVVKALQKINVIKRVLDYVLGHDHHVAVRITVGIIFMVLGVIIAKWTNLLPHIALNVGGDVLGYALHGIGLVPIIEAAAASAV